MNDKEKREYFKYLLTHRTQIENDPEFVNATLEDHLKYVPNGMLYKFRECSAQNFKALENQAIWMAQPSSFNDPFDNTIDLDFESSQEKIETFLKTKFIDLCFVVLLKKFPTVQLQRINQNDIDEYFNTCIDENGNIDKQKEEAFYSKYVNKSKEKTLHDVLNQITKFRENQDNIIKQILPNLVDNMKILRNKLRDDMLTYCMTEYYQNNVFWENYADNYRGFCIEYDFRHFKEVPFEIYKNLLYLMPITYTSSKPGFDIEKFTEIAARKYMLNDNTAENDIELNTDLNMQLYYKRSEYQYEKEWRFSIKNQENNLQYFPFTNAIYAGYKISEVNLKRITEIAALLKIPVFLQKNKPFTNQFYYDKLD